MVISFLKVLLFLLFCFKGICQQTVSLSKCDFFSMSNDFKRLNITICENSLYYYEQDYDQGPFRDTCKIKIVGRKLKILKRQHSVFPYNRISYTRDKNGIILLVKIKSKKNKKFKIPRLS